MSESVSETGEGSISPSSTGSTSSSNVASNENIHATSLTSLSPTNGDNSPMPESLRYQDMAWRSLLCYLHTANGAHRLTELYLASEDGAKFAEAFARMPEGCMVVPTTFSLPPPWAAYSASTRTKRRVKRPHSSPGKADSTEEFIKTLTSTSDSSAKDQRSSTRRKLRKETASADVSAASQKAAAARAKLKKSSRSSTRAPREFVGHDSGRSGAGGKRGRGGGGGGRGEGRTGSGDSGSSGDSNSIDSNPAGEGVEATAVDYNAPLRSITKGDFDRVQSRATPPLEPESNSNSEEAEDAAAAAELDEPEGRPIINDSSSRSGSAFERAPSKWTSSSSENNMSLKFITTDSDKSTPASSTDGGSYMSGVEKDGPATVPAKKDRQVITASPIPVTQSTNGLDRKEPPVKTADELSEVGSINSHPDNSSDIVFVTDHTKKSRIRKRPWKGIMPAFRVNPQTSSQSGSNLPDAEASATGGSNSGDGRDKK